MKYIFFEKSAVEQLINTTYFQSADFEQGATFASILKGEEISLQQIPNIYYLRRENGIFFVGRELTKTFMVIDIEKSQLFDEFNIADTVQIIQKLFRFAVRYWNKQSFTSTERILTDSNKAVIFPFSHNKKGPFRIVIEREADSERMAKRQMKQLLLVYKCGNDGPPSYAENPTMSNFRTAVEEYPNILSECVRENNSRLDSSALDIQPNQRPIDISEACGRNGGNPYMPFEKWESCLSMSQRDFVFKPVDRKPMRLQGAAGTGKTLSLILKAIYLLREAERTNQECKMIFFAHSKATQLAIRNIFDSISEGRWGENTSFSVQSVVITTLHEYCIDKLIINISENEVLERDAMDSKQLQYFAVCESYDTIRDSCYTTYKPLMSDEMVRLIEESISNKDIITGLLQHEFSIMIKGKAAGSLERYKKIPPLLSGLQAINDDDKAFVFKIFIEYQKHFELVQQYDTDDIVLTAIGNLDNPVWRRRRKLEGFDYIFIDETHLFNSNETMLFHYLTKSEEVLPLIFSIDISQAIGDQGSGSDAFLENYKQGNVLYQKEFDLVFRCSSQITDLAMAITASGASLFGHFRNPYNSASSAFTSFEETVCKMPEYVLKRNDNEMINYALECFNSMIGSMRCSPSNIAIVAFSELVYQMLINSMGEQRFIEIKKRGDFEMKERASKEKAVIISMPDYVGGLEFDGVILVGVDGERVPPRAGNDISNNYLMFSAFNKLYVSVTRAKYQVMMLGTQEFGPSPCLEYSIKHEAIKYSQE